MMELPSHPWFVGVRALITMPASSSRGTYTLLTS
ncbi:Uncharacterised protein [Bordetella pertussis]|nr:Uncharacterised protein [Bordetella pertussis]